MATRIPWSNGGKRTMPHRGGGSVRAIHGMCTRLCSLAALLLLLLGCDAVDGAMTRPSSVPADTVVVHGAPPSIPPVSPTPTERSADADLAHAADNYHRHDLDAAIVEYTQALALQPDSADAYQGRGLAYYGQGDVDRAIADFTQALALRPDAATIYNNRGLA